MPGVVVVMDISLACRVRVRAWASYAAIGWRRARHAASAFPIGVEAGP